MDLFQDYAKLTAAIVSIPAYIVAMWAFFAYIFRARAMEADKIRIQTVIQIHRKISRFLSYLESWSATIITSDNADENHVVHELFTAYNDSLDDFHTLNLIMHGAIPDKLKDIYARFGELRRHAALHESHAVQADAYARHQMPEAYRETIEKMEKAWQISRKELPQKIKEIHREIEAEIQKYIGLKRKKKDRETQPIETEASS